MANSIKESVENLISTLKNNSGNPAANFEATAVLTDSLRVECSSRQFDFTIDEPETLGGTDSAANPIEYVLSTLGACQAITYKVAASLKGIELNEVRIDATGHIDLQGFLGLDKTIRPGYDRINFKTSLFSDEDPKKLERLSEQVESLCPVLDIISNPVPVSGKLTIKKPEKEAV